MPLTTIISRLPAHLPTIPYIYNEAIEFRFRIQDFCQVHHARLLLSSLSPSPPLRILLAKSGRGHLISNFIQVGFRLACKYVKVIATVSFMISSNLSKPTLTLAFTIRIHEKYYDVPQTIQNGSTMLIYSVIHRIVIKLL